MLIVATAAFEELQVTEEVTSCLVPFWKIKVATNCTDDPGPVEKFAGARVIDAETGGVTVSVVEPATGPMMALIIVVPIPMLFATPPNAAMVAVA